jgi:hypothetical protein
VIALILGHAGGGDELLLALVPTLVFMSVYRLVRGPNQDEGDRSPSSDGTARA